MKEYQTKDLLPGMVTAIPVRTKRGYHFRKVKPDIPHGHAPEKGQRGSGAEPFRKDSERKI